MVGEGNDRHWSWGCGTECSKRALFQLEETGKVVVLIADVNCDGQKSKDGPTPLALIPKTRNCDYDKISSP